MGFRKLICVAALIAVVGIQSNVRGDEIEVRIENTASAGGFFFTPVFLGFHDGGFDIFDSGGMASASFTPLVEEGMTGDVAADLLAAQATSKSVTVLGDSVGPPPFDPGESISTRIDVDTSTQRFLNYASMVIPSNDAFFGNADALEIFDNTGVFRGTQTIEITAGMIYDAGTEVNAINGGAAFSSLGGAGVDESDPIAFVNLSDLNNFVGTSTVSGATINNAFNANTVVARLTISAVPEPGSTAVLGLIGLVGLIRRKRS